MPGTADLTRVAFDMFPVDRSLELLFRLASLDRFQGSRGIETAADLVAESAERAGLREVQVRRFPADACSQWWSFRAPSSWTPISGTVDILGRGGAVRAVSFPELPCSLATYSAPAVLSAAPLVEAGHLDLTRLPDLRGSVILLSREQCPRSSPLGLIAEDLEAAGAAGFITDLAAPSAGIEAAGRIELARTTGLFGFSVPTGTMDSLRTAARQGTRVRVTVRIEQGARMPVVHGLLPGKAEFPEILLQAHLCHPRPSANDNASGVAAAVGVAETIANLSGRFGENLRPVRLLWAPEFAGTAAFLHELAPAVPRLAVNLDMVGEDQDQCGGPLVIEAPPSHLPSMLPALAADIVNALPTSLASYSGAIPLRNWNWEAIPFSGGSDHALLADRNIGCSAICIGHWPDRFRHTSLDTPDRVDPHELHRAGTLAATLVQFARCGEVRDLSRVWSSVARWAARQMTTIAGMAAARGPEAEAEEADTVVDPFSPTWIGAFLRHQADSAREAMRQASILFGGDGAMPTKLCSWLDDHARSMAALLDARPVGQSGRGEVFRAGWAGPFNLQALEEAAAPASRRWLMQEEHGRDPAYTQMLALAHAIDGTSPFTDVVAHAACSTWLPIDLDFARRYLEVLSAAGWVTRLPEPAVHGRR